jgi:hypothetical protein
MRKVTGPHPVKQSNIGPLNQKKILTINLFFETFPMLVNDNR